MSRLVRICSILIGASLCIGLMVAATVANASDRSALSTKGKVLAVAHPPVVPAYEAGMAAANSVADQVESLAGTASGFAGVVINPWHREVDVYWHGHAPARLTRLAVVAASGGVTVQFFAAAYSQAQLNGFRAKILASPGEASAGVAMIVIYPQATGLSIGVVHGIARVRRLSVIAKSRIPVHFFNTSVLPLDLVRKPAKVSGVMPVDYKVPLTSIPGRWADEPPFKGGAAIESTYGGNTYYCSTGFGLHFANSPKRFFMLTAAHCIVYKELFTQVFSIPNNSKKVGSTFYFISDYDAVTLDTSQGVTGAGGSYEIYGGSTSKTTSKGQSLQRVLGTIKNNVGALVYTSGAFSGERSGTIVSTNVEWSASTVDGHSYDVFGSEAQNSAHTNVAGQGDSGGPIFSFTTGGVLAAGIVSAGVTAHPATCTGITGGRKCFWDVLFPNILSILPAGNLAVNTP
jgi:hypothetical protein